MKEVLTEKNKQIFFDHFHVDERKFFHKRLFIAMLFLAIYAVFLFNSSNLWLLFGIPFVMLFGFKIPYMELITKKAKHDIIKEYMFPTFLRYFISLLDTQGNVYQTMKATVPYVNEPIKSQLKKLIENLDETNINNRDAFMDFAEFIGSSEAHMILSMIYEFNEEGINKNDIKELESTIKQLQENKTNELIEYKVNNLDKHANPILIYSIVYILAFTVLAQVAYYRDILTF